MIEREEEPDAEQEALELYEPLPPALKLALGMVRLFSNGINPIVISDHSGQIA